MELPGLENTEQSGTDSFKINKEYAARYEKVKQKQELNSLTQKYASSEIADDDSSSSESEDEDAEALTPQIEQQFLKTLSMLQKKDPKIYDKKTSFFEERKATDGTTESKESKSSNKHGLYIKDYERQRLLEKGEKAFVSDSEEDSGDDKPITKTYFEEQEDIKKSFLQACEGFENEEDGELLHERKKTETEKMKEKADYTDWLRQHEKQQKNTGKDELGALHRYWSDPALSEGEKFLRDYILGRKYVDKDSNELPSYSEIVQDDESEEEDEDAVEKQEEFERKFNFRYEEPDEQFIKSYPRTIKGSVRRPDDKRSKKRKEREARKKEEKEKKKQELKQLKNLKRKEIMEKIEKLKDITGNTSVGFIEEDIDGDFDPKKYDELMQKVFNEDYYVEEEESKPEFEDDEAEMDGDEHWDSWQGHEDEGEYYEEDTSEANFEDPDFNMDADYDPDAEYSQMSKRQKKKSKLAQALLKKKPIYNPEEKSFEEYFDEYYKLDYEDIVGDLPVRFKYREVLPNTYGLTTEEILSCEDTELNKWCSLKRAVRYNTKDEERADRRKFNKKSRDKSQKLRILTSLQEKEENNTESSTSKRPKRKFIRSSITSRKFVRTPGAKMRSLRVSTDGRKIDKKAKRAKFDILRKLKDVNKTKTSKIPADRLAAYGLVNKKKSK